MIVDENRVTEVIGRLIGRAQSHLNAANQTPCQKKKEAHLSAWDDMISLANDLAEATDNPVYYKSNIAYKEAVKGR